MIFSNAHYNNAEHTSIRVDIDTVPSTVPVQDGNRHYRALLDSGEPIADYPGIQARTVETSGS